MQLKQVHSSCKVSEHLGGVLMDDRKSIKQIVLHYNEVVKELEMAMDETSNLLRDSIRENDQVQAVTVVGAFIKRVRGIQRSARHTLVRLAATREIDIREWSGKRKKSRIIDLDDDEDSSDKDVLDTVEYVDRRQKARDVENDRRMKRPII